MRSSLMLQVALEEKSWSDTVFGWIFQVIILLAAIHWDAYHIAWTVLGIPHPAVSE